VNSGALFSSVSSSVSSYPCELLRTKSHWLSLESSPSSGLAKLWSPCRSSYLAETCKFYRVFYLEQGRLTCHRSFFQSVCIIGYTLFPLVIASILSAVHLPVIARIPVYIFLVLWSLAAGISILGGSGVLKNRLGIAVYPLFVFYIGLGCLCLIS